MTLEPHFDQATSRATWGLRLDAYFGCKTFGSSKEWEFVSSAVRIGVVVVGLGLCSGALAASPCPHPFFPLEDGLELKYRAGKEEIAARFTEAKQGADTAEAKMTVAVGTKGKEGSTLAKC